MVSPQQHALSLNECSDHRIDKSFRCRSLFSVAEHSSSVAVDASSAITATVGKGGKAAAPISSSLQELQVYPSLGANLVVGVPGTLVVP